MLPTRTMMASLTILLLALSATAGIYYVEKGHAQAGDNKPGTQSEPWASVKKAAETAKAGDTVYVKNGTYYERVAFKNSGTASAYITFTAYPGHKPVINGRDKAQWNGLLYFLGVDYIRLSNLTVTNCGLGQAIYLMHYGADTTHHIEFTSLTVNHVDDSPIQIRGNSAHILVENCRLHDCGAAAVDASGYAGGRPRHITIRNNTLYNSGFNGMGSERADHLLVENNTIYGCDLGIDVGSGKNNIIRNNTITDCVNGIALSSNSYSEVCNNTMKNTKEAMYSYYWSAHGEPHRNNKWHDNYVDNATWGIYEMNRRDDKSGTGLTSGHEYYSNVFRNVGGHSYRSIFWFQGTHNIKFSNNTVYTKADAKNEIFQLTENSLHTVIKNNILALSGNAPAFLITGGSSADIDYNCYQNRTGPAAKNGANDIVANPQFENATNGDFRLKSTSPCINAGVDMGRPFAESAPDMGAFEHGTIGVDRKPPLQGSSPHDPPFRYSLRPGFSKSRRNISVPAIFDVSGRVFLGSEKASVTTRLATGVYAVGEWEGSRMVSKIVSHLR